MITRQAICAQRAIVDNAAGDLSLIGIINGFKTISFPVVMPSMHMALVIRKTEVENVENVGWIDVKVNDKRVLERPIKVEFDEEGDMSTVVNFQFIVPEPGEVEFFFRYSMKGKEESLYLTKFEVEKFSGLTSSKNGAPDTTE